MDIGILALFMKTRPPDSVVLLCTALRCVAFKWGLCVVVKEVNTLVMATGDQISLKHVYIYM